MGAARRRGRRRRDPPYLDRPRRNARRVRSRADRAGRRRRPRPRDRVGWRRKRKRFRGAVHDDRKRRGAGRLDLSLRRGRRLRSHTRTLRPWLPVASELAALLRERRRDLPEGSFSAQLFRGGASAIAAKLVEEANEAAVALQGEGRERTLSELTDLLYVMLVLATHLDVRPDEIRASLEEKRRQSQARRGRTSPL